MDGAEAVLVCSASDIAAALLARKMKNEAAPISTVPMTPSSVKMLALRLRAMEESDCPKQAAQASAGVSDARKHPALKIMNKPSRFTGS